MKSIFFILLICVVSSQAQSSPGIINTVSVMIQDIIKQGLASILTTIGKRDLAELDLQFDFKSLQTLIEMLGKRDDLSQILNQVLLQNMNQIFGLLAGKRSLDLSELGADYIPLEQDLIDLWAWIGRRDLSSQSIEKLANQLLGHLNLNETFGLEDMLPEVASFLAQAIQTLNKHVENSSK